MTKYKNWQILLWLFLWSTISIMCAQLPIWGSIAAIVAASVTVISAIILGGKSIRNWQINRKPFINIKCWWQLFDANNPKHSDLEYGTNDLFISFTKGKPNYSDKITATVGKYHIYLELTPQLPLDAAEINLRFLDSGVGIPHLIGFYDANRRPSQEYRIEPDGVGGLKLTYSPTRNIFKGKDIYYIITLEAKEKWNGKLSLRFYFVGKEARSTQISCVFD